MYLVGAAQTGLRPHKKARDCRIPQAVGNKLRKPLPKEGKGPIKET